MKIVQQVGGTADVESAVTGADRQIRIDTTNRDILLHDGVTPGGHRIPNQQNSDTRYQARSPELDGLGPYTDEQRGVLVRRGPSDFVIRLIKPGTSIQVDEQDGFSGDITISIGDSLAVNLDARGKSLQLDDGQIPASKISGLEDGSGNSTAASGISYVNDDSGLASGNVQDAIDEIVADMVDIQTELTAAYDAGNSTATLLTTVSTHANAGYNAANAAATTAASAFTQANAAYGQANTATTTATGAFTQANGAYGQANTATSTAASGFTQANNAFNAANTAATTASTANGTANTASTALATLIALLTAGGGGGVPIGTIVKWSGSIASIPTHWQICDGTNGTPNLVNRFVVGAGSTYAVNATGGTTTHQHNVTGIGGGSHDHTLSVNSHTLSVSELPAHHHTSDQPFVSGLVNGALGSDFGVVGINSAVNTSDVGSTSGHTHGITVGADGTHGHTGTVDSSGNLPPYYALAFIQRIS